MVREQVIPALFLCFDIFIIVLVFIVSPVCLRAGVQRLCTCYMSSYFCTNQPICHRFAIDSQLTPARSFFCQIHRDAKRCKFSSDECREFPAAQRLQIPRPCPCPLRSLANCLPTACQLLASANDGFSVVCRTHCFSDSIARRMCSCINFTHFVSSCSLRASMSLMCSSRLGLSAKLKKDSKNIVWT